MNLTGEVAAAIDGAVLRGQQLALAYVRDDGSPSVSFRGSTYVRSSTELAIWARKRDSGLAVAVAIRERPVCRSCSSRWNGPGARYLAIEGRARVAGELNDEVYGVIVEPERQQDPGRTGVAVIIDVEGVAGTAANGFFQQTRA